MIMAKAVVKLTVEVETADSWGPDCTIGQARQQAAESARRQVRHLLSGTGCVVQESTVTVVVLEDKS